MRSETLSRYATIGTICGGTAGVAQAILHGGSPLFALVVAALSGTAAGLAYGLMKLVLAARR